MAKEKHLHDAIKKIVNSYGKNLYYDKRMINYISDYYSFEPMALYNVMKTLITDGYSGKLIDASQNGDWRMYVTQSIAKVQKNYGFAPVYVNYCFQCLAYGVGLYPTINQRLLDEVEGRTPSIIPSQPPSRGQGTTNSQSPSTTQKKSSQSQRKKPVGANSQPSYPNYPQSTNTRQSQGTTYPPYQQQNSSQKQQVPISKGCGFSGCFDSLTNTYVIIIVILWVISQCSH